MSLTAYTIDRTFPVEPERLFRAFTDPDDLKAWVWGAEAQGVTAEVDLRPGGLFQMAIRMTTPEGGEEVAGFRGVYVAVEPPRRLVHTVHWDAPVGYNAPGMHPVDEVLVTEIDPHEGGSRLRYTHLGIPDDGVSAPEHERSVRATLDVLQRHLTAGA
jgi:uncharacterized protein YndB with AHSA1/START domain